jgi:hypothetical protein
MASYDIEKFEINNTNPVLPNFPSERKVYWVQNKHVHNAAMITSVKQWLDQEFPHPANKWNVRKNSYQSKQSSPPVDASAVEYSG